MMRMIVDIFPISFGNVLAYNSGKKINGKTTNFSEKWHSLGIRKGLNLRFRSEK